jgi:hypothetical protein
MNPTKTKKVDKDDGILGDGLAEQARKALRDRQAMLDEIMGDTPTDRTKPKAKPVVPTKPDKQQNQRM